MTCVPNPDRKLTSRDINDVLEARKTRDTTLRLERDITSMLNHKILRGAVPSRASIIHLYVNMTPPKQTMEVKDVIVHHVSWYSDKMVNNNIRGLAADCVHLHLEDGGEFIFNGTGGM